MRALLGEPASRRRSCRALLGAMAFVVPQLVSGCSYTLSESDCVRYRDKLIGWAAAKGADRKSAADDFYKSCSGTTVSKRTHTCLEQAGDEDAFMKCLE